MRLRLSDHCYHSVLFFPLLSAFLLLLLFLVSLVLFGFLSRFSLFIRSLSTCGCTALIPKIKQEKRLDEQEFVLLYLKFCCGVFKSSRLFEKTALFPACLWRVTRKHFLSKVASSLELLRLQRGYKAPALHYILTRLRCCQLAEVLLSCATHNRRRRFFEYITITLY